MLGFVKVLHPLLKVGTSFEVAGMRWAPAELVEVELAFVETALAVAFGIEAKLVVFVDFAAFEVLLLVVVEFVAAERQQLAVFVDSVAVGGLVLVVVEFAGGVEVPELAVALVDSEAVVRVVAFAETEGVAGAEIGGVVWKVAIVTLVLVADLAGVLGPVAGEGLGEEAFFPVPSGAVLGGVDFETAWVASRRIADKKQLALFALAPLVGDLALAPLSASFVERTPAET